MKNKLLIATKNPAKLMDLKAVLSDERWEIVGLEDLRITVDVEETGKTFIENAKIKAEFYGKMSGLLTLGDDGGFMIDYLRGEPGVKSKRWIGGVESSDEELIAYAIERLKKVPEEKRQASLNTALALFHPTAGHLHVVEDRIYGTVADKPSKCRLPNYPFRSLLLIPELNNKYYDELTEEEHKVYNHRRRAAEQIKKFLTRLAARQVSNY